MSLYDGYRLANSSQIKRYQGSTVPELVQVSQEMQRRYDTAAEGQDYVSRFMGGMQALDQDRGALQELSGEYKKRLNTLSSRKDLENSLRETTMLARDLPTAYAPFAQRMKDYQEYAHQVNKDVSDGKINQQTAAGMLSMSRFKDTGIQKDPSTGKFSGRFSGQMYVKDLNVDKKVDEWMDKAYPVTQGYTTEKIGDQWIVKQGSKRVIMNPERIRSIISAGAKSDQEYQSWVRQQQELGTYSQDYSKMNPASINLEQQVGSVRKQNGKKSVDVPVTLKDVIKQYTDQGMDVADAIKEVSKGQIGNSILSSAFDYGVSKFIRNDIQTEVGYGANPYGLQKHKDDLDKTTIPIAATIFQPTLGSTLTTPHAMDAEIGKTDKAIQDTYSQFMQWSNVNKVSAKDAKGNAANPFSPAARFFDSNGVEKTSEARKFIDTQNQAALTARQLDQKRKSAMDRAGYKESPALLQKAQKAYQETFDEWTQKSRGRGAQAEGGITSAEIEMNAKRAYQKALEDTPGFKRYQQILEQDAKGNAVPIGISTFSNTKLNEAIEKTFNNLSVNLDSNGLMYGAQGLEWGSGEKAGKALSADDYQKVAGEAKFAGTGIDADGKYKMFFKVGTSKTDTNGNIVGESMIVKMPAYTGLAENMVKEKQIIPAQQYLAQAIGNIQSSPNKSVILPLSDSKKVQVREVLPSEKSYLNNNPSVSYIITYFGADGKSKEVTADSPDATVNHIISTLQSQ